MNLDGKKIVVTGAASGIGAESAKVIKEEGGSVIFEKIMDALLKLLF